jgi:peptidoglycan/LPS O-acetylase OafA/YrhL
MATPDTQHRLSELDALRGIAALLVVLYHYTTKYQEVYGHTGPILIDLRGGRNGVQLFFAISGFVIFMTLERAKKPLDFVVSRFSRLYPAYWTALLLTTAVVFAAGFDSMKVEPASFFANLTMLEGWRPDPHFVDGAYWTLAVELAFYCCMFALYLAGLLSRIEPILVGWIGLKWLWFFYPQLSQVAGLLLIQETIPFFAIGICCYRLRTRAIDWRWAALILPLAIGSVFYINLYKMGIVAVVTTVIFLSFTYGYVKWLRAKPLLWLGGISYTLYLIHQNIGHVVIRTLEIRGVNPNLAILLTIAVVLGLAVAITTLIERPAMIWVRERYSRRLRARSPEGAAMSVPADGTPR